MLLKPAPTNIRNSFHTAHCQLHSRPATVNILMFALPPEHTVVLSYCVCCFNLQHKMWNLNKTTTQCRVCCIVAGDVEPNVHRMLMSRLAMVRVLNGGGYILIGGRTECRVQKMQQRPTRLIYLFIASSVSFRYRLHLIPDKMLM